MSLTPDRVRDALCACGQLTSYAPITPERFRRGVLDRADRVLHAKHLVAADLWHVSALLNRPGEARQELKSLGNRFLGLARYVERGLPVKSTSLWRNTAALLEAEILRLLTEEGASDGLAT